MKRKEDGPEWDVDTIVSTFTTTENRPRPLDDGVSITSSRLHAGPKVLGEDAEDGKDGAASVARSRASGAADGGGVSIGYSHTVLRLSRKTGLPLGRSKKPGSTISTVLEGNEGAGRAEDDKDEEEEEGEEEEEKKDAPAGADSASGEDEDDGDEEEEEGEDGAAEGDNKGPAGTVTSASLHVRRKGETAEERRVRKAAVKEERRERRAAKKNLKLAFKSEILRQTAAQAAVDALGRGIAM